LARKGPRKQLKDGRPAEIKTKSVDTLRQLAALLDAKAPQEASAVKAWLMGISTHFAEASKEGGFLDFGGVSVSDGEKATLAEIQAALKCRNLDLT
jgi:hypothetical protein